MEQREPIEEIEIHKITETSIKKNDYRTEIVWFNLFLQTSIHIAAPYGIYLAFASAKLYTTLFALFLYPMSMMGITAGAHRLWSHRSYKANLPLRIILMIFNTVAFQGPLFKWVRDHRLHHKYSETDADPHNVKRGFFFAHVGWLLCKKHPDIASKGKGISIDDVREDPVIAFQAKYYYYLVVLFCVTLPTVIPMYFWNETWKNAFFIAVVFRFVLTLNVTWLVNSVAHLFGQKPYDININPVENAAVSALTFGEGWHNFHHTFPWDYKTSELGNYLMTFNLTTCFIDTFAAIGWAYDLKTVSTDNIRQRVIRTGDGTHEIWGWGDKDQTQKERDNAILTYTQSEKEE